MFDRLRPYNALPDLPPPIEVETKAVLRRLTTASRSLAELKGHTLSLPNPDVLLSTIALNEAKDSSEIENIFTTHDELFRGLSLDSLGLSPHAKEVLHYRQALWKGAERIREKPFLTTNLFIELGQIINESDAGLRRLPGTRIANSSGEIIYTPPEGEEVLREKLAALERFANLQDDGLDPLIKAVLIHYQFEAIHPFHDGNGRTGRILVILHLLAAGLLHEPALYLSRYIIRNKSDYYRLLRNVTEQGAWEPWLLYMLTAIEETAADTSRRIVQITALLELMALKAKSSMKGYSKDLIEVIFYRPYCRTHHIEAALDVSRPTAASYLKTLEKIGLVTSVRSGREVLYMNDRLLALLQDKPVAPL
jgi:Fic family protein